MIDFNKEVLAGDFKPTMQSLRQYKTPEWFRDAKLGIWSHWGVQSVPMFGDWYARNMYIEGHAQYLYHLRHYGHPSVFGYKDLIPLWKAENFDPDALMSLYHKAGARYFVAQAMHHDNFDNFDSKYNEYNSVKMGPKKDIVKLWQDSAKKFNLPFGVTEHLGASHTWWQTNKNADVNGPFAGVPYDGANKEFDDFYHDKIQNPANKEWYTTDENFFQKWFWRMKDLIDKYKPDLLYSDGEIPFGKYGMAVVAHLYNTSINVNGTNEAVYNQKTPDPYIARVGVLDVERGLRTGIEPEPWQDDTTLADWFYDAKYPYKSPVYFIETLVDIISKNGCLLMNVPQLPDGSIDVECRFILDKLAEWMSVHSEAVHNTRPWVKFGEGDTNNRSRTFFRKDAGMERKRFPFHAKRQHNLRIPDEKA